MSKTKTCDKCGGYLIWVQSKAGKWVLFDEPSGRQKHPLPHYLTCKEKLKNKIRRLEEDIENGTRPTQDDKKELTALKTILNTMEGN